MSATMAFLCDFRFSSLHRLPRPRTNAFHFCRRFDGRAIYIISYYDI